MVGAVGSGKSSLMMSILGELCAVVSSPCATEVSLDRLDEGVQVQGGNKPEQGYNGKIAFVSQSPWILNLTVRENILMGMPFDQQKYNQTIEACCLVDDLALLPGGDAAEM